MRLNLQTAKLAGRRIKSEFSHLTNFYLISIFHKEKGTLNKSNVTASLYIDCLKEFKMCMETMQADNRLKFVQGLLRDVKTFPLNKTRFSENLS